MAEEKLIKILTKSATESEINDFKTCFYNLNSCETQMKRRVQENKSIHDIFYDKVMDTIEGELNKALPNETLDKTSKRFIKIKVKLNKYY